MRTLNTKAGQLMSAWDLGDVNQRGSGRHRSTRWDAPCGTMRVCARYGQLDGNLIEWDDLFHELPYTQGGFIWDWCDQVLAAHTDNNESLLSREQMDVGYGGDFGEAFDGRFCINGIVGPIGDRIRPFTRLSVSFSR